MSLSTMRKRHNATALAAIGLLASTVTAAPTAPLTITHAAASTATSNDLAATTLSTTHAPAFTATNNEFAVCGVLDQYDYLKPFPCGPWGHTREYTEFMQCLRDPKYCKGGSQEMFQMYEACTYHPEFPACPKPKGVTHGDGKPVIRSDNPIGDLFSRFRCVVDHTLPECKALGINAEGYVVPEKMEMAAPVKRDVVWEKGKEEGRTLQEHHFLCWRWYRMVKPLPIEERRYVAPEKMEVGDPVKSAVESGKEGEEKEVGTNQLRKRTSLRGLFCLDARL